MHGVREHPRHRGINKRSLGVIRPRRILQGSTTHACTIRLSKSRRATCASLAVLGPNRETIHSSAACQCKSLRFSKVRTSRPFACWNPLFSRVWTVQSSGRTEVRTLPAARRDDSCTISSCQPHLDANPRSSIRAPEACGQTPKPLRNNDLEQGGPRGPDQAATTLANFRPTLMTNSPVSEPLRSSNSLAMSVTRSPPIWTAPCRKRFPAALPVY